MSANFYYRGNSKREKIKKKGLNAAILSSFNNDKFFEKVFTIFNLSVANIIGSEAEDTYQDTMRNIWIFDIRSNIHICNSLKGFIKTKNSDKIIKAGATPLII